MKEKTHNKGNRGIKSSILLVKRPEGGQIDYVYNLTN